MDDAIDAGQDDLPEEMTLTLRKEVKVGDVAYAEVKLREPTAAEMMTWDRLTGAAADIKAISVVGAIPEAAVKQFCARDLIKGGRFLASFLS